MRAAPGTACPSAICRRITRGCVVRTARHDLATQRCAACNTPDTFDIDTPQLLQRR